MFQQDAAIPHFHYFWDLIQTNNLKQLLIFFGLLFVTLIPVTSLQAQDEYPFLPSETLKLDAYYNWGPFWVHAGDVELKADTITYEGKKCVNLVATGYSLKKWSFIFSLEDHYHAIVELNGFKPLYYEKNTMEGGYWIHNIYHFHWQQKRLDVFTKSLRRPAKDTSYTLNRPLFDVLSAAYYLRTINPHKLHRGDTLPIPLITDGEFVTYNIVYNGPGILKRNKNRVPCAVYSANITNSTFFEKGNSLKIYVTDDERQIVVYGEAKIIVGSIKIYQDSYQNMRPLRKKVR